MSLCFQLNTTDKDQESQYICPIERPLLGGSLRWNSKLHHTVSCYVTVLPLDTDQETCTPQIVKSVYYPHFIWKYLC